MNTALLVTAAAIVAALGAARALRIVQRTGLGVRSRPGRALTSRRNGGRPC